MAEEQNGVPEPIRHGMLRLVAHLFAARDERRRRAAGGGDGACGGRIARMRLA